jgi:hypothetical protein
MAKKKMAKEKRPIGRPMLFTPESLTKLVNDYFTHCDKTPIKNKFGHLFQTPYTYCGLAAYCGTTRDVLDYYSEKDDFFNIVKVARERILSNLQNRSLIEDYNASSAIFIQKVMGHKETQDINHNFKGVDGITINYSGSSNESNESDD